LEWLVENARKNRGLLATFKADPQEPDLDDDVRVVLFQAARELLMNVTKHANAKKVEVSMHGTGKAVRIQVEDDGVGFDPAHLQSRTSDGFGLFTIRERIEYLGGQLRVASRPGRGTRVTLAVPLQQSNHLPGKRTDEPDRHSPRG
jgi:signal transduction histidine kinase